MPDDENSARALLAYRVEQLETKVNTLTKGVWGAVCFILIAVGNQLLASLGLG